MRRTLIALAIAVAAAAGLVSVVPGRVSADGGVRQAASTVYRLDPSNGRLRVTVTLKVTNRTPDGDEPYACIRYGDGWFPVPYPATCHRVVHYYLSSTTAAVENESTGLKAVSGGKPLAVTIGDPGARSRTVTIAFPELFFGKSRTVKLTYTVKGGSPRSESATRTMRAYASFCAIANGIDTATVTVHVPKAFRVSTSGAKLRSKVVKTERVFTSGSIPDPARWSACFTGANDAAYRTQKLAAPGGGTIQLRSWPEDPAWAQSVGADVSASLPLLERLTGTGAAAPSSLKVLEASGSTGYAGRYDPSTNTVIIGEDFHQPSVVQHELAHVWFNRAAIADTWLSEGFAEWAGRTVSGDGPACARPDVAPGSVILADWAYLPASATQAQRDAVDAQYQAACYVVSAVATAAGEDRMTAAIAALLARRDPYAAVPAAQRAERVATWRDWLDAVDELALAPAGTPATLATDLLLDYGATTDRALLARRTEARQAYRQLVTGAEGWVVPPAVRAPMAAWRFDAAMAAVAAASPTWDLTGETDSLVAGVDARHGPAAVAWQAADTVAELDAAADLARRQLAAAREVAEARSLLDRPLDLAQQVGAFGTRIPSLGAAIPAIRAGDGDQAARIVAGVQATVADLRATGQQRMAVGSIALALALVLLGVALVRRARSASLRREAARLAAVAVAVAGPHAWTAAREARPVEPWPPDPLDDSPTQVWNVPIVRSDPDPDLAAIVQQVVAGRPRPPGRDARVPDAGVPGREPVDPAP